MPELHNLVAVYAKGFYDERCGQSLASVSLHCDGTDGSLCRFTFYERKREKRNTRLKGLFLAFLLGLGDYVATVI